MQDFFRWDDGYEAKAKAVAHHACYKLVQDMHYEARIAAVVHFYRKYMKVKLTKAEARNMRLTRDQFMRVNILLLLN